MFSTENCFNVVNMKRFAFAVGPKVHFNSVRIKFVFNNLRFNLYIHESSILCFLNVIFHKKFISLRPKGAQRTPVIADVAWV